MTWENKTLRPGRSWESLGGPIIAMVLADSEITLAEGSKGGIPWEERDKSDFTPVLNSEIISEEGVINSVPRETLGSTSPKSHLHQDAPQIPPQLIYIGNSDFKINPDCMTKFVGGVCHTEATGVTVTEAWEREGMGGHVPSRQRCWRASWGAASE